MEQTRTFLKSIGQPAGDAYNLPTSEKRFSDGGQYRFEVPGIQGPKVMKALLEAMESYGTTTYPVLRGSMNEPLWPDTFKGSIAHKDNIAIAAVTKDPSYAGIGIDIEDAHSFLDTTHARLFCVDEELTYVEENSFNATLFFSIKESVVKANYMAYGKRTEMINVNCCKLLENRSCPKVKVKYILENRYIISLCMIYQEKNKNNE